MSTSAATTVVFLHGIGAGPERWNPIIDSLPEGFTGIAVQLPGLRDHDPEPFSLTHAAAKLREHLDAQGISHAHVCGLSIGAMVAVQFAAAHPDRTASLIASAAQVKPPRALLRVQNAIMRVLPERLVAPAGMSKRTMLAVLSSLADTDLRPLLPQITAPTLVLCGSKDRPNLSAARELASAIDQAQLQVVPGAGHEWNTQMPAEFSRRVNAFVQSLAQSAP